jgi:hypothetical protein
VNAKRVEKKKANGHVIADEGRKVARNRHINSVKTVHDAMKMIEDDTQANGGIYPLNNGVISVQELLRRAGKSAGYLEKKTDRIVALKSRRYEMDRPHQQESCSRRQVHQTHRHRARR